MQETMCVSPNKLPSGILTGCRDCWQCRQTRLDDWVGRGIAESKTATACNAITLTYGKGDHARAAVLTYSDVQKYFKRLRKAGFPCAYIVAGEYGSMKARAHWHLIIYWLDAVPPHQLRKRVDDQYWPHGHVFWDKVDHASLRYVLKYILKDQADAEKQSFFMMSKKPPIGARYFAGRAQTYVNQSLAPQDLNYTFPEITDKHGKRKFFRLVGRSAEMFLEEYIWRWRGYPEKGYQGPPAPVRGWHYPESELVQEFEDTIPPAWTNMDISSELQQKRTEREKIEWAKEIKKTEKALADLEQEKASMRLAAFHARWAGQTID